MASLIDTLIDVLDKENTEYEALLKLSEEKTSAIVHGDVEKLQEILGAEQKHIDKIDDLDKDRIDAVNDICSVLKIKDHIKIDDIVELLSSRPKEHDALQKVHLALKRTLDQLMRINENNKTLLTESMDMIDFELNLARNAYIAPQTTNYGKSAYEQGSYDGATSFDAKQ